LPLILIGEYIMTNLLELKNVSKIFPLGGIIRKKRVIAVDSFSLEIPEDQQRIITLAGESGSGKTTITNLLLGFIKPTSGEIIFRGKNLWKLKPDEWKTYRREVQAVFQDPYESYNTFYKMDHSLITPIKKFRLAKTHNEAVKIATEALWSVGLNADEILNKYPHELSGGQRQRVMLARVFALKPKILLADEPVSMIDISLRADILKIIQRLQKEFGMSCVYITHDLSNAFCISNYIIILYLGSVMEEGDFQAIIKNPKHPYVKMLIDSIPKPNPKNRWDSKVKLQDVEIARLEKIQGCKFSNRCSQAKKVCREKNPDLVNLIEDSRKIRCFEYV